MDGTKILFVDHNAETAALYRDFLNGEFRTDMALTSADAMQRLRDTGPYAVVVTAMDMPGTNGAELLAHFQQAAPETSRIMLTSSVQCGTAIEAINKGHVFEFVPEPCLPELVQEAVRRGVLQHRLATAEKDLLEKTLNGTVKVFAELLSMLEIQTFDENQRVRRYAKALGELLAVPQLWELEAAAQLSQIAFLTIPASILQKIRLGVSLNDNEKMLVTRAPEIGARLLSEIPRLEGVAQIILYQTKSFDGTGFPENSVAGQKIPLGARILKVASTLAKLESASLSKAAALQELRRSGAEYDPAVLDAAAAYFNRINSVGNQGRVRAIPVNDVRVGHVLAEAIFTKDGLKVVGAGTCVTPFLLEKLQNFMLLDSISDPVIVQERTSSQEAQLGNAAAQRG
jgi:response regulator RpfG family c-di-GMP phosphodiesterase